MNDIKPMANNTSFGILYRRYKFSATAWDLSISWKKSRCKKFYREAKRHSKFSNEDKGSFFSPRWINAGQESWIENMSNLPY